MTTIAPPERHEITLGDSLTPLKAKLKQSGRATDTNGLTVTFRMIDSAGTVKVSNSTNTAQAAATAFTAAITDVCTDSDHGLVDGDEVVLTTTGTLPAGLALSTTYWIVESTEDTFKLSLAKGGTVVDITDTGTGTHSYRALGHVQYDFQSADVDDVTAGESKNYLAWFTITSGGELDHFPPQSRAEQQFGVTIHSNV